MVTEDRHKKTGRCDGVLIFKVLLYYSSVKILGFSGRVES